ncbi:hypothetical protein JKF63_07466 [Porcisia hertigi]|uniref:USP domain-containing protein n=1 Tax=Porcisia hertigi TaxID=2761500 RepID=A0A836IEE4_9TRYP|nr:hypothetical protein JKF63_07466 [Porcisia hertigi]
MAKPDMNTVCAAAVGAQVEGDTTVPHQEPPPPAELPADAGPGAAEASLNDPVEFIVGRVDSIEQWRATVVRLNATQIGVSLLRGVLRRGHLSTPPMRAFETTDTRALAADVAEAREAVHVRHLSQPVLPSLHTCTTYKAGQSTPQITKEGEATGSLVQKTASTASPPVAHPYPLHTRSTPSPLQASVARRTLVQTASRASAPLYKGILAALVAHGVASIYAENPSTDSLSASRAAVEGQVKAAVSTPPLAADMLQATSSHLHLTLEMNAALHEIHRAAAEVMCIIDQESQEMKALTTAYLTDEDDRVRDRHQVEFRRSCRRLSLIVANLYSLVALLDFFALEDVPSPIPALSPTASTAASVAAVSHPSDRTPARENREAAANGAGDRRMNNLPSDLISASSALAAPGTATAEEDAPTVAVARCAGSCTPGTTPSCPTVMKSAANPVTHPYTLDQFHRLFDASSHLPQSVWRVFSATATTLSEFEVTWSLATGDAQSRQAFNNTACLVLGEDQRCLLLQLHRFCARFAILRHQVYALHPVNHLYFKVKQMLEWSDLFNAGVPDEWSYDNGDVDRCDLHNDLLHNTYVHEPHWCLSPSNKAALQTVMASLYAGAAGDSAHRRVKRGTAFVPSGRAVAAVWPGSAPDNGGASAPLSLLASLVSAGTNGRASASLASLLTGPSAEPRPGPSAAASCQLSAVPGYVGLRNSGNTCFLNSVVQLLGSAALFRDDLMVRVQNVVFSHSARTDHRPPKAARTTDGEVMADLFTKYGCRLAIALLLGELQWRGAHHHKSPPVLPDYLTPHLPPPFGDQQQHDASEFWHALLDQLDMPNQPGGAVVAKWFSGRTTTTMRCVACQRKRLHTNTFWDICTPLLRNTSASTAPVSLGGGPLNPTVEPTLPAAPTTAAVPVVSQVEVQQFAHATAVSKTYVCPLPSDVRVDPLTTTHACPMLETLGNGEEDAVDWIDNKTARVGSPTVANSEAVLGRATPPPLSTVEPDEAPKTLQHLLLHVLHPILNKELLHGSNALDCEHCRRRTDTELTTRLVAELDMEGQPGLDAVSADLHGKGVSVVPPTRVSAGCGAADAACKADEEGGFSTALPEGERVPQHVGSKSMGHDLTPRDSPTHTAAGGGLPYYLAVQLNRFAYQRVSQSYRKITDGVPLNEVIIVPVYPGGAGKRDAPQSSFDVHASNLSTRMTSEERGNLDMSREDEGLHGGSVNRPSAVVHSVTPKNPVWVAYRLKTIIIHSGTTPNSGHYFILTRRPVGSPLQRQSEDEDDKHSDEEVSRTRIASDLSLMRAYVKNLGSALTSCLHTESVFSEGQSGHPTAGAGDAAGVGGSSSHTRAEATRPQSQGRPAVAPLPTATEQVLQSPTLSLAPTLPTAAVSVSGDSLYENWVMLNDSHVQPVEVDTMRRILHGCGGGVYSSMETPYIILYEKVPIAFEGTAVYNALSADEEVTNQCVADAALSAAVRLQWLWETHDASVGTPGDTLAGEPPPKPVQFAPEVMQIFSARLKDEAARNVARSSAVSRTPKPYIPPFYADGVTPLLPLQRGPLTSEGTLGANSRESVARSWSGMAGDEEAVQAPAARVAHVDLNKGVQAFFSNRSASRSSASHRPRRLTPVAKYTPIHRTKRYSAHLSREGSEGHREHSGTAHEETVLSSSSSDAGPELDDNQDRQRC